MKRRLFSLVVLLGLMISPIAGVAAQPAASDQTYISQITGDEIDLGTSGQITWLVEDFDYRETRSFQEEFIWFTYGWSNFQMVLIDGPNDSETYHVTTLGNMEQFYDSWNLLGEDITENSSWFLAEAEFSGSPLIVYYEFELDALGEVDLALLQFTDISTFQRDLEVVQSEVTLGGEPLLPDTDAAELAALVDAELSTSDPSSQTDDDAEGTTRTTRGGTDATTEEDDDEEESTTTRTTRGGTEATTDEDADDDGESTVTRTTRGGTDPTTDDDPDQGNTSETSGSETDRESRSGRLGSDPTTDDTDRDNGESASTPVSGGDWSELGLISDSEWQSPNHGNVITWDTTSWQFPNDFEFAIVVSEDPPYDILTLQTVDGLGYVYITLDDAYESTPRSLVDYWTSDEYSAQLGSDITVLETGTTSNSASIVYETLDFEDQPVIAVLEASFTDDGQIIFSQITAAPDSIHLVYAGYVEGVEIDGASLEMTFTVEDIQDISGN